VAFGVGALMLVGAAVVLALTIRKRDVQQIDAGEVELTPA
jgi:hypothetical protein